MHNELVHMPGLLRESCCSISSLLRSTKLIFEHGIILSANNGKVIRHLDRCFWLEILCGNEAHLEMERPLRERKIFLAEVILDVKVEARLFSEHQHNVRSFQTNEFFGRRSSLVCELLIAYCSAIAQLLMQLVM